MASPATSSSASSSRPYALLVYGATGYTGRLTARYLAKYAPAEFRWGVAGRDASKLAAIADEVRALQAPGAQPVGVVVGSGASARDVARAARVVVSTAGPFLLHGEPLLAACVAEGTDYLDITGETLWVDLMAAKYGEEARRKGVCVVPMSGFDSVPADLGAFFLADHVRRTAGARTAEVCAYVAAKAGVSGGTIASMFALLRDPRRRTAANPLLLTPGPDPKSLAAPISDVRAPFYAPLFKQYAALFVMAAVNTRVVRRSAGIFALEGEKLVGHPASLAPLPPSSSPSSSSSSSSSARPLAYSTAPFRYSEYMLLPRWASAWGMTLAMALFGLLTAVPGVAGLIHRMLPQPGQGPSPSAMRKSWFHYYLVARTEEREPRTFVARVRGGDGGYEETSKMLAEGGLAMALQRASLPGTALGGGFLTPATCFGSVLVDRLRAANILFEVLPEGALPAALRDRRPAPIASQQGPGPSHIDDATAAAAGGAQGGRRPASQQAAGEEGSAARGEAQGLRARL
jgi:short subunit dehydrogenase-like uncharacterized protein